MKFGFIALLVFVLQCQNLVAELQGPVRTEDAPQTVQTPPTTTSEQQSSSGDDAASETVTATKSDEETPASGDKRDVMESVLSNERKSSKYVTEKTLPSQTLSIESSQRSKILHAAIFERLWNEKLMKEKYRAQIEEIESAMEKTPQADPTPEQIDSQNMYEQAMEMLPNVRSDKRVAYALLRKAAELHHKKARCAIAYAHLLGNLDFNFEYAAAEFDDLAKAGLQNAHMGLAFLYSVGVGGKNVSQPLALIHLTIAALNDDTFAQMALGYRYSFGINVPISCEKSLTYYRKVAKKVAKEVTFASGPVVHRVRLLDESENPGSHETEIVDYYQLLADKGDVQSQVGLGQLYYQGGKAIAPDHQKALEYFTLAANAGNAIGYAFLGKLYLEGGDVIKADNETAMKYFKKAADLNDPVGQSGLGLMYLNGLGVPKDALKALNYFTLAAEQGWVDGQLQLGNMYFTGNGVKTDYKLALKYFNLASQSGHVLAYYNLGIMHAYGMGMLRSCPAAVEFFKNVAERGHWSSHLMHAYRDYKSYRFDEAYMRYALLAEIGYEVAQSNAAFLLDRSDVTIFNDRHEDLIRAFYYWKRAAAQGYSAAQVKLGDYYYYGWGTTVDFETAAALYRKASEQQYNAQAMFNLGYMHEQGLGMKKDWHLAKRQYDLAAETNADAKVPVAIALLKLQILAKVEAIKASPYKFIFYLDENIAANWDLYMITILTLMLGFVMYTRRPYQQAQQQEQQPPQQQQEQQPPQQQQAAGAENTPPILVPTNENVSRNSNSTAASSTATSNETPNTESAAGSDSDATRASTTSEASTADPTE